MGFFWKSKSRDDAPATADVVPEASLVTESEESPDTSNLPKPELRKIAESKEKIQNANAILRWKDYTVVINTDKISVFDDLGNTIKLGDNEKMTIDINWKGVRDYIDPNCKNFTYDRGNESYIGTDAAPKFVTEYLRDAVRHRNGSNSATISEMPRVTNCPFPPPYTWSITHDGKYITIFSIETWGHIIFQCIKDGSFLSPRNWIRIDSGFDRQLPNEMNEYKRALNTASGSECRFRHINDRYIAQIECGRFCIREKDIQLTKDAKKIAEPMFSQVIDDIGDNFVVDPNDSSVVYYCEWNNPMHIMQLRLRESAPWEPRMVLLPRKYSCIHGLSMDPSGSYFLFSTKQRVVALERNSLEEFSDLSALHGHHSVHIAGDGRIQSINPAGFLTIHEADLADLAVAHRSKKAAAMVSDINTTDLFSDDAVKTRLSKDAEKKHPHLQPVRSQFTEEFTGRIALVNDRSSLEALRSAVSALEQQLSMRGLQKAEIDFVMIDICQAVRQKEVEVSSQIVEETIEGIRADLDRDLGLLDLERVRVSLETAQSLSQNVTLTLRDSVRDISSRFEQAAYKLFQEKGEVIEAQVSGLVEREAQSLSRMERKAQFDEWIEFTLPELKKKLSQFAANCPAECQKTFEKITEARVRLVQTADQFAAKFQTEYEEIRRHVADRSEHLRESLEADIKAFIERIHAKGFSSRASAEQFIQDSQSKKQMEDEIEMLREQNEDAAKEVLQTLKVSVFQCLREIELKQGRTQGADGREMELFGKVLFPRFESSVKEKKKGGTQIAFLADDKTKGAGVPAEKVFGDVGVNVASSDGTRKSVALWEGQSNENDARLGSMLYKGKFALPTYVTQEEYREIKSLYLRWKSGELKAALKSKRLALSNAASHSNPNRHEDFPALYADYAAYCHVHRIPTLRRIEELETAPIQDVENGHGLVPEWRNHWVVTPEDEEMLETMTQCFKMQLELQEGMLNLRGHAGTGKDVLIKMFAHRTRRPYFSIDCTKWTTEFELSEDIQLESEDGASRTLKVPSTVLTAIQTLGALLYFNEFNAMPEQAQIFLHALMDEKRSLTLKTSSGKTIKAHPSVLLAGSMNPGYPGTFNPQMATKSRMVTLQVNYPALRQETAAGDANPEKPYAVSEALKIARSIDSLSDLTLDPNMESNEFVGVWNGYVNCIGEKPTLTSVQEFDLNVTLALVQFAEKLRSEFANQFSGNAASRNRNSLPVSQPFTLREMRRCAYVLSQMSAEEKLATSPEATAKKLIGTFFLSHIDRDDDRNKIQTALSAWTSQKRVSV